MPLPAVRCRPEQTIVKMEMAPDLSLRGRFAPVAISRRHWRFAQATVKMVCTDCVCSGAQRAPWAVANMEAFPANVQCLQVCHCEAPKGPWQSREGSCDFAEVSLLSGHVLRDCHVASLLAMTRQAGAAVHQCPRAVELPRTGRSLTAATLACALGGVPPKLRPARRSLSAATDAIGLYVFIDSLCESAALRRARLSPPLQSAVGTRPAHSANRNRGIVC